MKITFTEPHIYMISLFYFKNVLIEIEYRFISTTLVLGNILWDNLSTYINDQHSHLRDDMFLKAL